MADEQEAPRVLAMDMNGNPLREGDLVMILLEKPALVGFITEMQTPSVLTSKAEQAPGIMVVNGRISIPFDPRRAQYLRQTAKLVNPGAENFVNKIMDKLKGPGGEPPTKLTFVKPQQNEGAEQQSPDPLPNVSTPVEEAPKV